MAQRTGSLLVAFCLALSGFSASISLRAQSVTQAAACGSTPGTLLQSVTFAVDGPREGQQRITRTIDVPAGTDILLVATETGVDVRVELQSGTAALVSDNPVRRWGPQRLVVPAGSSRTLTAAFIAKEGVRGRVRLDVLSLPAPDDANLCSTAVRLLADGDASFARGQLISLGLTDAPSGSARKAYVAAVESYQRAATTAALRGTGPLLANAHLSTASVMYQGTQQWSDSLRMAQLATDAYRRAGDAYGVDRSRAMAAAAEMEVALGVVDAAPSDAAATTRMNDMLDHVRLVLNDVASSHARRNEPFEQALALNNVGLSFNYQDRYDHAIPAFQSALKLYERLGERRRLGQTLQNLAVVQQELAKFSNARESYGRVLQIVDPVADPNLYADVLNNLARTETETGDPDSALRHFSEALVILTRIQSVREQARSLHGIGSVYDSLGNRQEALEYFDRALALRTAALDPLGRTDSLRTSANVLRDFGRAPEAIARREEALRLAQSPVLRARILVELAQDESRMGAMTTALSRTQEAIADQAGGDRIVYARALLERARLRLAAKSYDLAQPDAAEAVAAFKSFELPASTFDALLLQARIDCARGAGAAARERVEEALTLTEQVRRASTNPALRTSVWQSLRPAFELGVSMAASSKPCGSASARAADDSALEALDVAERSRNRALEDYLDLARMRDGARAASPAEERRRALFETLAARRMQIESLSQSASPGDSRLRALQFEVTSMKRDIDILDSEIAAPLRQGAARTRPASRLRAAIETIPAGAAVIEYWLGNENTYAWLITKGRVRMVDLGPTERVVAAASRLHDSLRRFANVPAEERVQRATELHSLIVAPLPADAMSAQSIYFVPDGALHYVPFALLANNTGGKVRYLIEDHDVAIAPSLLYSAATVDKTRASKNPAVLIVSDPVYTQNDARFGNGRSTSSATALRGGASKREWPRLIGSQREAASIAALFPPGSVDSLTGFAATRDSFLNRDLARYDILHIATHGLADAEAPQLSTLVLSSYDRAGRAIPGDVFAGDLLLRRLDADLVVLSACETSLGAQTAGEGLLGLRYAAHASGARSVVASLWPVADAVGAQLMSDFYSRVVRERMTPMAALSQAMRAAKSRWQDPALWGVFEVSRVVREPAGKSVVH